VKPTVAVIGTVFVDCKGFSKEAFDPAGRNLGQVKFFHGGVGRNVAENLANLQIPVIFASTVDRTGIGHEVVTRLQNAKVNVNYISFSESCGMGFWLALLDNTGDLAGAISQMPDLVSYQKYILNKGKEIIEKATDVVLELDLNIDISRNVINWAKEFKKPVYGIPGNLSVVSKYPDILAGLDCFVCNNIEAAKLMNVNLDTKKHNDIISKLIKFVDSHNMRSMVITLGSDGAIYYDSQTKASGFQEVFPVDVIDTSGAGDAFFSGTVMGLVGGQPLKSAVAYGAKVASWTIQCKQNNCPDLQKRIEKDQLFQVQAQAILA
jgi:pseudouridine kinase